MLEFRQIKIFVKKQFGYYISSKKQIKKLKKDIKYYKETGKFWEKQTKVWIKQYSFLSNLDGKLFYLKDFLIKDTD